ncbi:hypothetical protein BGCPKDLD_1419 [Methylorubrum suomiense]|uniref:Proteolipid membrane potential modulator n=1 Tax=Methylorubrum suomiense TaxID=144191 RepID=A0ABQ4URK4_9HYPH|nr:hypothetical protein BGCPKDLD_1419 [Methylorubrum suomiense]
MEPSRSAFVLGPSRTSRLELPLSTLIKILIAFFLPPISVLMTNGFGLQFLFNVLLCLLFYIPGSLHALYLLLRDR